MYQKILVAVDGSDASYHALKEAVNLSKLTGGSVEALFVFYTQIHSQLKEKQAIVKDESGKEKKITLAEKEEEEVRKGVEQIGSDAHISIPFSVKIGNVPDEIINAAKTGNADIIVIGSTGKSMTSRILLGSVSAAVVEKSPIPVLVTRTK